MAKGVPYYLTTLGNGLRVLTVPMVGVESVAAMVWVAVGSRYETEEVGGVAHFLEHLVMRGTKKYKDQEMIHRRIEGIGGMLNAMTSFEFTTYLCKVTKSYFSRAIDLISQVALYPTLSEKDIKEEVGNIIEEINRYEDMPDRRSEEEFYSLLYQNNPLGRPLAGTKDSVKAIKRSDFVSFRRAHYSPDKMTVVVSGAVLPGQVVREVRGVFGHLRTFKTPSPIPIEVVQREPEVLVYPKQTAAQAHVCMGVRGFSHRDTDKYPLMVLNAILGEGGSSRLFINVRNKKGLAYAIQSTVDFLSDTGSWETYAGFNIEKVDEGIGGILIEIRRIREDKVGLRELAEGKEKVRGPLLFMLESTYKMAEYYGGKAVIGEELLSPEEEAERVMAVTAEDVRIVAQRLFVGERLNLAIVGPYQKGEEGRFLRRLHL